MVKLGERVVVDYILKIDDGTEYVNTKKQGEPFEFVIGQGVMLPDFENAIIGLNIGDSCSIHISSERAYGNRNEELVIEAPPTTLPNGEPLPEGSVIGLDTPEGIMRVKVLKVEEDKITLDCNHELAGKALRFDITLVDIISESLVEHEIHAKGCKCGCDRLQEALS